MISELFWQCGFFRHHFGAVLTVWYSSTWFLNCSDSVIFFDMISELLWQCCISYMISELFRQCSISYIISELFWQCSISYMISELFWQCGIFLHDFGNLHVCVHDFGTVLTVWYFSAWFRHCSDSVVFSDMIFELFWQCGIFTWFLNCSDSVVLSVIISELFWQCGIFLHDFGTVLTVLYFLHNFWTVVTVWYISTWLRNCSESVVFFDMISELLW